MEKSAFNEKNQPYFEVFKVWLEKKPHTSILELINWENLRNKIKISFYNGDEEIGLIDRANSIRKWELVWSKKIRKEDIKEKTLELKILLYQWFAMEIKKDEDMFRLSPTWKYIDKLEQELTNYRYWKKIKKLTLIFGIILALALATYLMWPNSEKPHQDKIVNNDWPLRPNRPLWL